METARPRILNDFPYPVAYPYSLIFNQNDKPSNRRWALCFTEYQLLRVVCLPLVSQYLHEPINDSAAENIFALNKAIAAIRSPFFSDWIVLAHTLRKHLAKLGIEPLFPGLGAALDAMKQLEERPIALRNNRRLDPLNAILALRNATAHGGLPDQAEAQEHIHLYVPVLHQVLDAFDFVGDSLLKVQCGEPDELDAGRARICTLRGAQLADPVDEDRPAAFSESPAVVLGPQGKAVPLYPLFKPVDEQEPLSLYDGHYGIRVETRQGEQERSYIYYLGTHHHSTDSSACEHLKELLARRRISFYLEKGKTAPWTIADSALDYSRRTLEDLLGTKYFPECYLALEDLEHEFEVFLRVPEPGSWGVDRARRRYVNGFGLVGLAGTGKTAFLARQTGKLLQHAESEASRENPNLVLFLRGNAITLRSEGMSLFRDVAERLGIAVEGSSVKPGKSGGFSSFRELLDHLDRRWKEDRLPGRRLILILDALNEAPYAENVIKEALEMAGVAACYPWCKIVFSIRQEWLSLWSGKMGAQETSPLEELRPFLYQAPQGNDREEADRAGPPVITIEAFTEAQAEEIYRRYRAAAEHPTTYAIPACRTPWSELPAETRSLLRSPLYLHLFMATFNAKPAEPLTHVPALFKRYVDTTLALRAGLRGSIDVVIAHLLQHLSRSAADLTDDDCHEIRRKWAEALSVNEARLSLSPVEALAHEGMIRKRVREEGGGYRFVFQTVAECMIYRYLADTLPSGGEELPCWVRRAKHDKVFAEYADAFGFLLRDWESKGTLAKAGQLVEASPPWMRDVLTRFLLEQARVGYIPGTGSASAELAANALVSGGGEQTASGFYQAGYLLSNSRFSVVARYYFKACREIYEGLYRQNPGNVAIANGLGASLNSLGLLLSAAGQVSDAERAYRRSVEIREALYRQNPENVDIAKALGNALNNLGNLLSAAGQVSDAERAYRRSVEISEALYRQNPENVGIPNGLGTSLNNLGLLLRAAGQVSDAERAYRRSVEIREALYRQNPENVDIAKALGNALNNLGNLLSDAGQVSDAERAYRRSVEISEALYRQNPENVGIADGLAMALSNLGLLLRAAGQVSEGERAYRRSVEISEALYRQNPENVDIANGLGASLSNLGNLLRAAGQISEAKRACRRSVEISEALYRQNPENVDIANALGRALNNLGSLLSDAGQVSDGERACRRSVEISEALYRQNPENVGIADGLARALNNVGLLLRAAGQVSDAERAYRRSVEISEALYRQNPENVDIAKALGNALNNLGNLLSAAGQVSDAERAYRRSVEIREALYRQNPENVGIANGLGTSLNNLGLLLRAAGQVSDAERAYRRSVEIREALYRQNPENVGIANGLGTSLNNLGLLLRAAGQVSDAERVYRRSVEIREALYRQNPENVDIAKALGNALNSLGNLLSGAGQVSDAERAYRRSVEISEALYRQNPENVGIADGLGRALNNLGSLLSAAGQVSDGEQAYRRSVEISEALYRQNPENVAIKAGYASSLCLIGKNAEAKRLIEEVLALVPTHPHANQLARFIAARARGAVTRPGPNKPSWFSKAFGKKSR